MSDARVEVSTSADARRAAIRFFHPKGNIITAALIARIASALDQLAANRRLRLLTIEGDWSDFSFGASVPEHAPDEIDRVLPQAHALVEQLLAFPSPTAALVRGRCLGGGFELALACDFLFAESGATFGLPEIALGVFPPAACVLLPARVGLARATAAIVTGAPLEAAAWHDAGLVTAVSAAGRLAGDVEAWFATHLVPRSAEALRQTIAAARLGLRDEVRTRLPQLERLYLDTLMKTADAREGVAAFLGKRRPNWNDC